MHKNGSSNTVWLIEKHTPGKIFDGDTCLWEGQYRIRHLATGRLLAVIMEPGEVEDFNEDVRVRGNDRAAASGASPRAARSGALVLTLALARTLTLTSSHLTAVYGAKP